MFREMRRVDRKMSDRNALELLFSGKTAVLAVNGDDGYPYAVPLNFACERIDEKIIVYFHSATVGHKIDAVNNSEKVSICVVGNDEIIKEKYSTAFSSVIAFGSARVVADEQGRYHALKLLIDKYSKEYADKGDDYIAKYESKNAVSVIAVEVEHITGKER